MDAFKIGQRVQLHPATDYWMMGARYAEIVKVGRKFVHVRLDATNGIVKLAPRDLREIL